MPEMLPADPFNRAVALPAGLSRQQRVQMLREVFEALLAGETPSDRARLFVASGGAAWLREGGNLTKTFWKVEAERGSHRTPRAIARALIDSVIVDERQNLEDLEKWREQFPEC